MTMTRQHFALIASVLEDTKPLASRDPCELRRWHEVVGTFASRLARTNSHFNHDRFLKACGVDA